MSPFLPPEIGVGDAEFRLPGIQIVKYSIPVAFPFSESVAAKIIDVLLNFVSVSVYYGFDLSSELARNDKVKADLLCAEAHREGKIKVVVTVDKVDTGAKEATVPKDGTVFNCKAAKRWP